jgi:hypothetical protein
MKFNHHRPTTTSGRILSFCLLLGRVANTWWWTFLLLAPLQMREVASWSSFQIRGQSRTNTHKNVHNQQHVRQQNVRSSPWQLHDQTQSSASTGDASAAAPPDIELHAIAFSGLTAEEFQILKEMVETACWEGIERLVACNSTSLIWQDEAPSQSPRMNGALGRVLLLHTNLDDESIEMIESAIGEQMDGLLYSEPAVLTQPVLVKLQNPTFPTFWDVSATDGGGNSDGEDRANDSLQLLMEQELDMYELNKAVIDDPVENNPTDDEKGACPTIHVELDAAHVTDAYSSTTWLDTSTVLVFDDLVNDDLRQRLLSVVLGPTAKDWNDIQEGPDPKRWVRGGLLDTPSDEEEIPTPVVETESTTTCWGLRDEAVEEICFEKHDAIDEFEKILSEKVFPQFIVSRLPEAVFGACVSPLTANAPTHGDHFDYHIDGDPNLTPPSPWTDVYGRYPNRLKGKPRFMSCLIYLNDEWDANEWGAPTRFLDLPTDQSYDVFPKPGRCVIMDQDVSHTVVAPNTSADKRPRYSMVWKLILHPKEDLQEMTSLAVYRKWPEPILFGSAKSHM